MGKPRILIVDDEEDMLRILDKRLSGSGYEVFKALDGNEALKQAREFNPHLILLDIMMPKVDGLEVKVRLKDDVSTADIPVIFLTAKSTIPDKIKGLRLGVDDYITKPFDLDELLARIESVLERRSFYEDMSMKDGLTGVYNIHFFKKQFSLFFNMAKRYKRIFTLAIIDIDEFKKINDTHGHMVGDFVLKKLCAVIKETLRESDIITRYGGDEFVIILPESDQAQTLNAMERIRSEIDGKIFTIEETGAKISFSVSMGVATYQDGIETETHLFDLADANMYKEKKSKEG